MAMSPSLQQFLHRKRVHFDLMKHQPTHNPIETARIAHISPSTLARAEILRDDRNRLLMAVIPSKNRLSVEQLNLHLKRRFEHLPTDRLKSLFQDCDSESIPALGDPFDMDMICDEQLLHEPYVYLEAGDRLELVKIDGSQFANLVADKPIAPISVS